MRRSIIATASVALLVVCAESWALTIDQPGSDALLHAAGFVFEGRVLHVDPTAGGSAGARTRIALEVLDILSGDVVEKGQTFDFEVPEGELPDGRFVELAEAPHFAPGERYLVFYRKGPWHHTPVVGWSYGVLRRVPDTAGDRWVDVSGRCVAGIDRHGFVPGPRITGPAPTPPGWPRPAEVGKAPGRPGLTTDTCTTTASLRAEIVRRLLELGIVGSAKVSRTPAPGGWIEAPASERAGDAP